MSDEIKLTEVELLQMEVIALQVKLAQERLTSCQLRGEMLRREAAHLMEEHQKVIAAQDALREQLTVKYSLDFRSVQVEKSTGRVVPSSGEG